MLKGELKIMIKFIFFLTLTFTILTPANPTINSAPYEQLRTTIAHNNLERFMQQSNIPQSLWVDACCSGGGYRAMISTIGFIAGLQSIALDEKTNLYNCIRNIAGLSGSTWAIGHLMARDLPLDQFVDVLRDRLTHTNIADHLFSTLKTIAKHLELQYEKLREIQIVDLYGGIIADQLMGDLGEKTFYISFNDLGQSQNAQKYPHPIFTAIHPYTKTYLFGLLRFNYFNWFEINPDITRQTLAPLIGNSTPTGLLGVPHTTTPIPDFDQILLPLSSIMGICGSAYACSIDDIIRFLVDGLIEYFKKQPPAPSREREIKRLSIIAALEEIATSLSEGRLCPAKVPNFTQHGDAVLELIDAGIDFNLPLPPLLERRSPVIIICDADASLTTYSGQYPHLYKAAAYARKHKLPFPSLKYPEEPKNTHVLIFKRNKKGNIDPKVPTIIYFHNTIEKSTFDFSYTKDEFNAIFNDMFFALVWSADIIREEIKAKILQL